MMSRMTDLTLTHVVVGHSGHSELAAAMRSRFSSTWPFVGVSPSGIPQTALIRHFFSQ